jgi:hypothetical protein
MYVFEARILSMNNFSSTPEVIIHIVLIVMWSQEFCDFKDVNDLYKENY